MIQKTFFNVSFTIYLTPPDRGNAVTTSDHDDGDGDSEDTYEQNGDDDDDHEHGDERL